MTQREAVQIHSDNLAEFRRRKALVSDQHALSLRLLIEELLLEELSPTMLYREFCKLLSTPSPYDKALFCQRLFSVQKREEEAPDHAGNGGEDSVRAGAHGTVALVRNRYNDEAFSLFSHTLIGAKRSYYPSFTDVCDSVVDGWSEFCLLPLENTQNGRLFGFYSMMDRYELKICAATETDVEGPQGRTRYALVGRSLPERIPKNSLWNFECSVVTESDRFPSDILQVAPILGAKLLKIDTLPVQYNEDSHRIYFTFRTSEEEAAAFDFYLTDEHRSYATIGLYPVIRNI